MRQAAPRRRATAPRQPLLVDRRRFLRAPLLSRLAEDHSAARAASQAAPSSALPICCSASTARSGRAPCSSPGTRWRRRPTGTSPSRPIKAAANSTTRIIEQLKALPKFVAACGFANAKGARLRGRRFSRRGRSRRREARRQHPRRERRPRHVSSSPPTARRSFTRYGLARWRVSARRKSARAMASIPQQVPDFIALRGDASDQSPGLLASARPVPPRCWKIWKARSGARGWQVRKHSRHAAALSLDRDDGQEGAAPKSPQAETQLGQGGGAGEKMGAEAARHSPRRACRRLMGRLPFAH